MSQITKFDELNTLQFSEETSKKKLEVIPIDIYFDEMDLSKEEKTKRTELAYEMYDAIVFLFTLIRATEVANGDFDVDYYIDMMTRRFEELVNKAFGNTNHNQKAEELAKDLVETTINHYVGSGTKGKDYWVSNDRATINAENDSNLLCSDEQYRQAISNGFTKKKWVTMHDKRVRHTHEAVDGEVIGIKDAFEVGSSELMFPMDLSLGASLKEICNCRCSCEYLN